MMDESTTHWRFDITGGPLILTGMTEEEIRARFAESPVCRFFGFEVVAVVRDGASVPCATALVTTHHPPAKEAKP